jgi:nitroreductase
MTLYETMFRRISARSYDPTPLPEEEIDAVLEAGRRADRIADDVTLKLIAAPTHGHNAPHYLAAYCDGGTASVVNAGYVLQQVALFIESKGYGTCFLGMAKPDKEDGGADYCICLAFGKKAAPALRNGQDDFPRLPLEKICRFPAHALDWQVEIARAVRIAPSAMNFQPWLITFTEDGLTLAYRPCAGLLRGLLKKKGNKIDLGIALAHILVAAQKAGLTLDIHTPADTKVGYEVQVSVVGAPETAR